MPLSEDGRCLRRALDQKVQKIRSLLTADEDITTELDRVVCRLMKLALRTSRGCKSPPPFSWMQCKLFDLLNLTEKAIEKRKQHFIDNYAYKAIEYCTEDKNIVSFDPIKTDPILDHNIVSKYDQIESGIKVERNDLHVENDGFADSDFDDILSLTSNDFENNEINYPTLETCKSLTKNNYLTHYSTELDVIDNFDNNALVPCPSCTSDINFISSDDTNQSVSNVDVGLEYEKTSENTRITNETNALSSKSNNIENQNKVAVSQKSKQSKSKHRKSLKLSYSKLIKRLPIKKSSSLILLKYKYNETAYYKSAERKKPKKHQLLQSKSSKPIPSSLKELCNTDLNMDKNLEQIEYDQYIKNKCDERLFENNTVAVTEKSLFIGIVTEEGEELIALRRHIGTDPIVNTDIMVNEDTTETVLKVTKHDSFSYKQGKETENVESQTIFLYDLNEPTTSKGIRHLSADVQCGPDVTARATGEMLSATTSYTKLAKAIKLGIKIEDSHTNLLHNNKSDFGTTTELLEGSKIINARAKSVGITIKDSDTEIKIPHKTECSTMTQDFNNNDQRNGHIYFNSKIETKLIKPVSSTIKMEDSGSESISPSQVAISSKNTSDFQIQSVSEDDASVMKTQLQCSKPKLICGGVHVHSFKERQVSEDVVYQGEWQRKSPKVLARKNPYNFITRRNVTIPVSKISLKDNKMSDHRVNENKAYLKKSATVKFPKTNNFKKEPTKRNNQDTKSTKKGTSTAKTNKNVPSKLANRSNVSKNTFLRTIKSLTKTSTPIRKEKEPDKKFIKNYIPPYLRRKLHHSLERGSTKESGAKTAKENDRNLLKVAIAPQVNVNYIVFRNEIETENGINNTRTLTSSDEVINNLIRRNHSPHSQNSSSCSSPNSVATVRPASTRNKAVSNRRNSTSSDRSTSGNLESDTKSLKSRKIAKRIKNNKRNSNILTPCNNKENIPESSKNPILKSEKPNKNTFLSGNKNVFIAQMASKSSTLQSKSATVSKSKSQSLNKPIKHLDMNIDVKKSDELSISTDISPINNNYSIANYSKTEKESKLFNISDNTFIVTESSSESKCEEYSKNDTFTHTESIESINSSIMSSIRLLLQNNLNRGKIESEDNLISDSKTVIINKYDDTDDRFSPNTSKIPLNINSMIANEKSQIPTANDDERLNESQKSSITYSALDRMFSVVDNDNPETELDLMSFKSSISMPTSKFSEYYLADNELDNTLNSQDESINLSSLQDIFERKDQNALPSVSGVLALQAFSGFSVNAEPIVGDQPDYINLIDSETGSIIHSARQAASEELFVSGRSSDTYETCYIDDDTFVPNWLFNVISQQQSIEESDADDVIESLPMPLEEPPFDVNGNVVEPGVGVGAGAGDGRGMHSDQSQDSSGRDTSLSSSETSSGPQSEAVLFDPTAFSSQANYSREPLRIPAINISFEPLENVAQTADVNENDTSNRQNVNPRICTNRVPVASDADADISSLDTDAVDSEDE